MKATLTSKGQITIPARIREKLGLRAGQVLEFDEDAPFLKATKAIAPQAWDNFRKGADLKDDTHPWSKMTSAEIIEEMRGPVELPPEQHNADGD